MPEITQKNFRILLPGRIASAVMIASSRFGRDCFEVAKQFYDSQLYAELERGSPLSRDAERVVETRPLDDFSHNAIP